MRNKNKKESEQMTTGEDPQVVERVKEMMGPPPGEPNPTALPPKSPKKPAEPTGAPIIPNEALPPEITQEDEPLAEPVTQSATPSTDSSEEGTDQPDDPEVDKAVDDIVAHESDELLRAEDEKMAKAFEPPPKPTFRQKIKHVFQAWWGNPKARWATIVVLLGLAVGVGAWPASRYLTLNTVGVRASANLRVLDASTQQPLKNVQVSLADQITKTGDDGIAKLDHLKLGPAKLTIKKRAFAPVTKNITIGWGSNPLETVQVAPTGTQYTFFVNDFMSDKPLGNAEAASGDANAQADEKGKIVLTIDSTSDEPLEITLSAPGYRKEQLMFSAEDKTERRIKMVPGRKHAFISKRSGKYDVYTIDVDGKNEKVLFRATGNERDDIVLVPHPSDNRVALVSTRDNTRNKEGFLLSSMILLNADTGEATNLGQSEKFQVVDWIGDHLVYVQIAAGASANNPTRQRLISYNYKTESKQELASANSFNDVLAADGSIYYAPSGALQPNKAGFYRANTDGSTKQTILSKEVWNIFRTQYDHLSLSVQQDWYDYTLGGAVAGKVSGAPASLQNRLYRDGPDKKHSLWVDQRDGKGVLLRYSRSDKSDKVLRTQSGLNSPVYWLNDRYIVYRIHTDQETADYIMNLDGGEPRKIRDVSNVTGASSWYYYQH